MRLLATIFALLPLCAQSPDHTLAREIFQQLIEINTTDSSGDNTRAAEAMAARFRAARFPESEIHVITPVPRKGNLVVRLRAAGVTRPILFLGHLDVVEARRADWPFDPFVFRQEEGYYYGRGTADMKGDDATLVAAFLRLKRENFKPARDLILGRRPRQRCRLARQPASRPHQRPILRQPRCRRRPHQKWQAHLHGHAGR